MAIDLSTPISPTIQSHYAGMAQAEVEVWERFLRSESNDLDQVFYNVRVGTPPPTPPGTEPNLAQMWREINMTRLDALGIRGDDWIVFEVKVSAGLGAIGQAISGRVLADLEDNAPEIVEARIVTDDIRPDAVTVARALRITIHRFPST